MRGAFLAIVAIALLCHAANALRLNAWHSPHRAAHALRCRAAVAQEVGPEIFEGIGAPPSEWLASHADEDLAVVLKALLASCAQIATKVRTASCDSEACFSPPILTVSEDEDEEGEMAVDVLANDVLVSKLGATGMVSVISSTSDGIEVAAATTGNQRTSIGVGSCGGRAVRQRGVAFRVKKALCL